MIIDTSSDCGDNYRINLGTVSSSNHPSAGGVYRRVCTSTSDGNFIYRQENGDKYAYYTSTSDGTFWVVSDRIGGSALLVKFISSGTFGCLGPESSGIWLVSSGDTVIGDGGTYVERLGESCKLTCRCSINTFLQIT